MAGRGNSRDDVISHMFDHDAVELLVPSPTDRLDRKGRVRVRVVCGCNGNDNKQPTAVSVSAFRPPTHSEMLDARRTRKTQHRHTTSHLQPVWPLL
jgi:hypothetical protein